MPNENKKTISSLAIIQAWDYISENQPRKAIAILEEEYKKKKGSRLILYSFGLANRMMNNYELAEDFYLKALSLSKQDKTPFPNLKGYDCLSALDEGIYCQLGIIYQMKEDYEKAIKVFKKAININKGYGNSYNSLAITYRKMEDYEKSLETYDAGKKALVEMAVSKVTKDSDQCFKGKKAIDGTSILEVDPCFFDQIRSILKSNLDYSVLCCNMARCYVDLEYIKEAKDLLYESIDLIPEDDDYNDPYIALKSLDGRTRGQVPS